MIIDHSCSHAKFIYTWIECVNIYENYFYRLSEMCCENRIEEEQNAFKIYRRYI